MNIEHLKDELRKEEGYRDMIYLLCKDLDIKEEAILIVAHMCFQLGRTKTAKFKKMFEALAKKDYITAGFEMEDSLWAKKHTPARAMRLSEQMKRLT